jgi:hypothetical protein
MLTNPTQLEYSDEIDVTYYIQVALTERSPATAPFCRCIGYVRDSSGELIQDGVIQFVPIDTPVLYGQTAYLQNPVVCTIQNGLADVHLIRGGRYRIDIPWMKSSTLETVIPDLGISNLPDILFPLPALVEFSPASLAMSVGEVLDVGITVTYRNGLIVTGSALGAEWPISFVSSNANVVTITRRGNGLITASCTGSGSAEITAARSANSDPLYIYADPGVTGTLPVTGT